MQSLLRWSIENSTASTGSDVASPEPTRRPDLDPGVIDAILGRPDSDLMKEALSKAQYGSLDEDTRLTALVDLEMVMFSSHTMSCHIMSYRVTSRQSCLHV